MADFAEKSQLKAALSRAIREEARSLGFSAVGFSPVHPIPGDRLLEWLRRGYHGQMGWLERNVDRRLDPSRIMPEVGSVISLALGYQPPDDASDDRPDRGILSSYATGLDYHEVMGRRLDRMVAFIRERVPAAAARVYVDTGPVLDKYWASRSGLGWLGKHTNILSRRLGSWFFLGEILLDRELEYDEPAPDHCGSCNRCLAACPTDAIVAPYVLDSRRCISYLTIELREDIPVELRAPMGNLIYGCDICQQVCPWNRRAPTSGAEELAPREENLAPRLRELARLKPEEFPRRFARSPVKRTKWRGLMRNVAVAMGNSGRPEMLVELEGLLNTDDSMVRRHAAWAIGRIGTKAGIRLLEHRRQRERDPETLRTLDDLLSGSAA